MDGYKMEVTLNEKDCLQDMLIFEKTLLKVYSTVWTETVSKQFREVCRDHLNKIADDQLEVFMLMTELGYYRVECATEEQLNRAIEKFSNVQKELC